MQRARKAVSSIHPSIVKVLVECLNHTKVVSMTRVAAPVECSCRARNSFRRMAENRDISIYGQESNQTTWRLSKMNLAIYVYERIFNGEIPS